MNTETQTIAQRIQALLAKTIDNGCTEAEAMAAAEKAAQLMAKHRLTHDDIELKAEKIEQVREETKRKRPHPATSCCPAICVYTGVMAWKEKADPIFFGLANDVMFARYLFRLCVSAIDSGLKEFKKTAAYKEDTSKHDATKSFAYGMAKSMATTLRAMAAAEHPTLKTSSGTALVPMRNALVNDAFRKLGLRLKSAGKINLNANGAYEAGQAAGARVQFSRPINDGGGVRAIASR